MQGLNGNDLYFAGAGNDTILEENGSGVDTINYSSTTGNLVVNAYGGVGSADGAYTITGASGTDIINHTIPGNAQFVEVFVLGSGNDSMIANRYAETISMGAGNDTVQTGSWSTWLAGGDLVDGGAGNDWLDYSYYNSPNTIIANLATGRVTAGGATRCRYREQL